MQPVSMSVMGIRPPWNADVCCIVESIDMLL
jgi:hypothetical protein